MKVWAEVLLRGYDAGFTSYPPYLEELEVFSGWVERDRDMEDRSATDQKSFLQIMKWAREIVPRTKGEYWKPGIRHTITMMKERQSRLDQSSLFLEEIDALGELLSK